ncbi:MAG TPA: rhomboid family intramembrane serine protease [Armatimonadota bacterium]
MVYRTASGRDFSYWLLKDRIPVTKLLILANAATFLLAALFSVGALAGLLVFQSSTFLIYPWTALTYPLQAGMEPIGLIFSCYWLWVAGGSLERTWGSSRFAYYFFANVAITAVGMYAGGALLGLPVSLVGLWLPLSGVTIAWAMMNPEQEILFFFVIPMKLKFLALIDVLFVLIAYKLPFGIFALAGCIFSYLYIRRSSSGSYRSYGSNTQERIIRIRPHQRMKFLDRLNVFKWYREYKERKRLEKFLGKSNFPDL